MKTLELLEKLSNAFGPPGDEEAVRRIVVDELRGHVDEMRVDALGNLLVLKRGTGQVPLSVMLAAHMDEVALMIMGIDSDGTLRFRPAGGLDDRVLLGKALAIGPERIPGVVGVRPIHLLKANERTSVVKMDAMRIDIGAENKDAAARQVKPGDYAVFATQYARLGLPAPARDSRTGRGGRAARTLRGVRRRSAAPPDGALVKGKAFDDRAGCTVLVELLRGKPFAFDVCAAFTVQEEIGTRGARVAAFRLEPDAAFVLETTTSDDLPKEQDVASVTRLGQGPAVYVMDRSMLADRRLVTHLVEAAQAQRVPYQMRQPIGSGGTDGGAIHLSREGVPTGVVAVPARYIHSPAAILDPADLYNMIKLMRAALDRLTPDALARD